ncbi:MAG TPA: hypothetical protein VIO13_11920 [Candidatus Dormibacteraeota bacterium]|jgi:hypothetical protein
MGSAVPADDPVAGAPRLLNTERVHVSTLRSARERRPISRLIDRGAVRATALDWCREECALHAAHQSHVEAWITAASEKLHQAVVEHIAATAAQNGPEQP